MNDRFLELSKQAWDYVTTCDDRYAKPTTQMFDAKFAELIVKECASLYFRGIDEISAETEHKIYDLIIKHFGVEE